MKKRLIFLIIILISVFINIIPLVVFRENISFSKYSIYPCLFMSGVGLTAFKAYIYRRQGDFLRYGRPFRVIGSSQYSKEYRRTFYWQFTVYCFIIPFFIPCIFLSAKPIHLLWTICVALLSVCCQIIYGIIGTIEDAKKDKITKQKLNEKLQEQEKKEELGRFK